MMSAYTELCLKGCIYTLALLFTNCVILVIYSSLYEPQFLHLYNEDNSTCLSYFVELKELSLTRHQKELYLWW